MPVPESFLRSDYALLHGDDGEGRKEAMEAWKTRNVDPEWADFSLTVCAENCPWAEVQNALSESAPLGAERVVLVPQAEKLLERTKDLPPSIKTLLSNPIPGTKLLLVARSALSAASGRILGSKPFSDWVKEGRVLKVGNLEDREAAAYIESQSRAMGLKLDVGLALRLATRLGGHPGILRRHLEVLDLLADDRRVTDALVDQATFRLGEQSAYAWSQAWQKGQVELALTAFRQAVEDDPSGAPLLLLSQARREVERLCRLVEARKVDIRNPQKLAEAMGLSARQMFLLDGFQRVVDRIKPDGVARLHAQVVQADLDIKGMAISASPSPLTALTVDLCRAWGQR